jgi:uncharacterized lipoprotein YajG
MKRMLLLLAASSLLFSGCAAASRAVGMVARPVAGALNAVTGPVRGMTN